MQFPFVVDFLGLRRNVVVLSLAIFCLGLGEEPWARFLPKYLEALGASVLAIGAFGTLQDLLEGLYPYPGGVLADQRGRIPFVVLSFVCFALFPFLLANGQGPVGLIAAFRCAGLWEMGEPARKAMIVDLADVAQRERMVGVYYFTRGLAVMPASLVGGVLWKLDPQAPFCAAASICLLGVVLMLTGRRAGIEAVA
jgi:MFS family permease